MVDLEETEIVKALPEVEEVAEEKAETQQQNEADEVSVVIEGMEPVREPTEEELAKIRELRKIEKKRIKRIKELEEQLSQYQKPVEAQLGEKPTLESCGYDEAKFETELTAWHSKKRQIDDEAKSRETEAENQRKAWQSTLDSYDTKKKELAVKDYADAEDVVRDTLSPNQQAFILQGASNPAVVVYALGKHPDKAAELAAIKDHVKFIFAIAKFESSLKVTSKKAPAPEKPIRGSAGASVLNGVDKELEKLRAQAAKTGNYTQVVAYKKQLRAQGKSI